MATEYKNIPNNFTIKVMEATQNAATLSYLAAHNDYESDIEDLILDNGLFKDPYSDNLLSEPVASKRLLEHCIKKGHWGVIEHATAVVYVKGFPHTTMQQLRTHRTGVSFDVNSGRFTSRHVIKLADKINNGTYTLEDITDLFWFRPIGTYQEKGKRYEYTETLRLEDIEVAKEQTLQYAKRYTNGAFNEICRDSCMLYNIRQNFVLSFNLRSLMHLIDMRSTEDVDYPTKLWAELAMEFMKGWVPSIAEYYEKTRYGKNRRSP